MQKHIYLEIQNHKVAFAISVNGIELVVNRFHQMPYKNLSINQYVFSGENEIRINLAINPHWNEELKDQSCKVDIIEYTGQKPDFKPAIIKTIEWKYIQDETSFPVNIIETFNVDVPYGDWLWRKADKLTEDTIPMDSLKQFISTIHKNLHEKNYPEIAPLLSTKAKELADAYYIPESERLRDQESFFTEDLFSDSGWGMAPLDFNTMQIVSYANGRLLEIFDQYGKPFLKALPGEEVTFSLPLRVSYFEGKWVLCR